MPKSAVASVVVCFVASSFVEGAQSGPSKKTEEIVAEYCRRAKEVPPTNAEAHYRLGLWCVEQGLQKEAATAFERAIAIDSDHEGARNALGYVRYGVGWKKESEIARSGVSSRAGAKSSSGEKAPAPAAGGTGSEPARTDTKAGQGESVPAASTVGALGKKKAWAEEAETKFKTKFLTHEDEDFLIHTTLPSLRHPRIQSFIKFLTMVRKELSSLIGVRRNAVIWPDKLQFVFMKAKEELQRFAAVVDQIDDPIAVENGYITEGGRGVVWRPTSDVAIQIMGESAFERLEGSDRWVAWWIKEGVAELLTARLLARIGDERQKNYYRDNYIYSWEYVQADPDNVTIYTLLETPSYRGRERERKRALAMTLVDYLVTKRGKSFHALVRSLKSEEAPPPPEEDDEEAFETFYLDYLKFQRKALETAFRRTSDKLEVEWKAWLEAQATKFNEESTPQGQGRRRN